MANQSWDESKAEVRFGLILSGDKLVDNIDFRRQLLKFEPEAIGGEMFGAAPVVPRVETVADKAVDLLMALLRDEPMLANDIQNEVEVAGVSWRSAQRAKAKLGIVSIRREDGRWYWSLPARQDEPLN